MEKFCQSCAMPLNETNRGKKEDGSSSLIYCDLCYGNGKFFNENMTYEEMLELGIKGIENSEGNKIKKMLMKKSYPFLLKKCKRWN